MKEGLKLILDSFTKNKAVFTYIPLYRKITTNCCTMATTAFHCH